MKTLGHKTIEISQISNLEEITCRVEMPRIRDLAATIKNLTQLHEPIVRESDMRLLAGRDRAAANILLKHTTLYVKVVECTDTEAREAELVENIYRRYNPEERARQEDELIKLVTDREAQLDQVDIAAGKRGVGRPRNSLSPQGRARDAVAKATGISRDSVRRKESRRKAKVVGAVVEAANKGTPLPATPASVSTLTDAGKSFKLLGVDREFQLEFDPAFFAGVLAIQGYLRDAMSKCRSAGMALNQLKNSEIGFPSAMLQRLIEENHDAYSRLKNALPSSICPHCKCLAGVQEECAGCHTLGWISQGQEAGVPKELWVEDRASAVVQFRGGLKRIDDVIGEQVQEPVVEYDGPDPDDMHGAADGFGGTDDPFAELS